MKFDKRSPLFKRFWYTIFVLVLIHFLGFITIPGINSKELLNIANNSPLTILSMFSGGSFDTFSIMSMGVTAYITAQIIIQLLQADVIPKLTEWSKAGEVGRHKLDQTTRALTFILSIVQATGITAGINSLTNGRFIINGTWYTYFVISMLMTAGTFISMWFADQITEKGLGNGVSVLIAAGIIAKLPTIVGNLYASLKCYQGFNWYILIFLVVVFGLITLLIVWFTSSELRIPVQYARREAGTGEESYLPLKIIIPGVVPVIFASSVITIPQTLLLMAKPTQSSAFARIVKEFFSLDTTVGILIYGSMIIFFTYLYSIVQIEPEKLAENLQKQEAYIPEYMPGVSTSEYIKQLLYELSLPGSLFLTFVSIVPMILAHHISTSLQIGLSGSSLLIITGVLVDIGRQIKGLKMKQNYGTFFNKQYEFK